jgi:hypothetical protein
MEVVVTRQNDDALHWSRGFEGWLPSFIPYYLLHNYANFGGFLLIWVVTVCG